MCTQVITHFLSLIVSPWLRDKIAIPRRKAWRLARIDPSHVVCHNPLELERQRKHRKRVLTELEAEIGSLKDIDSGSYTQRVFELLASRRCGALVHESVSLIYSLVRSRRRVR